MKKEVVNAALCALAAVVLSGCVTGQSQPTSVARPLNLTKLNLMAAGAPEVGKDWSESEFRQQITGRTFLRNVPGRMNAVLYFAPNNVAYGWVNKEKHIESSTWSISLRRPPGAERDRLFVCLSLNVFNAQGQVVPNQVVTDCSVPGMFFAPFVDHTEGDVFGIEIAKLPPFELPIERTTIDALRRAHGI